MKLIKPTPAKLTILDTTGASYALSVSKEAPAANIALVLTDGSSFKVGISQVISSLNSAVLSDGSSFRISIDGLDLKDVPSITTEPPVVLSTTELTSLTLSYISTAHAVEIPLAKSFSNSYVSGANIEYAHRDITNDVSDDTQTETTSINLTRYLTPSQWPKAPLRLVYSLPSYTNRLVSSFRFEYGLYNRATFKLPFNNLFLGNTLKYIKPIPISYVNAFKFQVSYDIAAPLTSAFKVSYDVAGLFTYVKTIEAPLNNRLTASKVMEYTSVNSITKAISFCYRITSRAIKAIDISYSSPTQITTAFNIAYEINIRNRLLAQKSISFVYVQEVIPVSNSFDITLLPIPTDMTSTIFQGASYTPNVDGTTTITTATGDIYHLTLSGDIVPISNTGLMLNSSQHMDIIAVEPMIVINGEYVFVTEMDISIDEGNFTYTLNAKLGNYADLVRFSPNTEFYAVLQGEPYSFIVDSRSINRHEVNAPVASIKGVSLSNRYTGNRSKQIVGTTFTEGETSREIALKLLSDNSINHSNHLLDPSLLSWEILDWQIPPFRFGAENIYPLDGVKTLAEAVGGVVESYPNGSIRVRYKHPVRVPDYSDATVDHVFNDADDIISLEEQFAPNRKVDNIYVKTFQDIGVSDQIEFFDHPGLAGVEFGGFVRVFPAFWRDVVELTTTRLNDVELEYMGVEYWRPGEIDAPEFGWETIEIVRSQGSTRYPIQTILGYQYLNADCGGITLQDYSKTFYTKSEVERFSLIKLAYTTKCHKWRVRAPAGAHIQFLIKDNVFNSYLR